MYVGNCFCAVGKSWPVCTESAEDEENTLLSLVDCREKRRGVNISLPGTEARSVHLKLFDQASASCRLEIE